MPMLSENQTRSLLQTIYISREIVDGGRLKANTRIHDEAGSFSKYKIFDATYTSNYYQIMDKAALSIC